jgi:hypothetical protein
VRKRKIGVKRGGDEESAVRVVPSGSLNEGLIAHR